MTFQELEEPFDLIDDSEYDSNGIVLIEFDPQRNVRQSILPHHHRQTPMSLRWRGSVVRWACVINVKLEIELIEFAYFALACDIRVISRIHADNRSHFGWITLRRISTHRLAHKAPSAANDHARQTFCAKGPAFANSHKALWTPSESYTAFTMLSVLQVPE